MPSLQADAFLANPAATRLNVPAILLAGDETYLVDKALRAVLERVITVPGAEAFDLETRDAADLSVIELETLVGTPPLMNDRRVVLLKNVPSLPGAVRDRIKETLAESPATLCLIGTGSATMRGNLYQLWEKAGLRIVCELPRRSARSKQVDFDYERWLTVRAKADFEKRLDREAARELAALAADLHALYSELEKVALYVGGERDTIERADVEAVCTGGAIGTVWEWCDAVGAGDRVRAFRLLGELLEAGESAYRLVPLLAIHFCRLGVVLETGSSDPRRIMEALPGRSWYAMAKGLADQARRHTPQSIARALDLLAEADRMLKSTGHRERFVMDRHLLEIFDAAA
ncbi:MAG TPA: DNA polymerase III subunit delta [Gemmatimonadota bacterium]|jgi:DNA polymerase III delta subunit|nr:DNA polymerase III subunit delta [Gemmatimonadota bacterium]